MLARVALADGKVSEDEVGTVRSMFDKMKLTQAERTMCGGNCVMVRNGRPDACASA